MTEKQRPAHKITPRERSGLAWRRKRRVRPSAGGPAEKQTQDDSSSLFEIHALRMGTIRAPGITSQVS